MHALTPRPDEETGLVRDMVFMPAMIERLVDRSKTATRRIFPFDRRSAPAHWNGHFRVGDDIDADYDPGPGPRFVMLRGLGVKRFLPVPVWKGDRIIVKERFEVVSTWSPKSKLARIRYAVSERGGNTTAYVTTEVDHPVLRTTGWKSARFMPRVATRLALAVTGIKVHRLSDITDDEAIAEGIHRAGGGWSAGSYGGNQLAGSTPRMAFAVLWDVLHAKTKGHAWRDDPYVLAIRFRVES